MDVKESIKHYDINKNSKLFKLFINIIKEKKVDLYMFNKSIKKNPNYYSYLKENDNKFINVTENYDALNFMRYSFRKNDRYYDINTYSPINFYTYLISFIFPSNFNVEQYMKKMNIIDEFKQKVYKIYDVDFFINVIKDIFDEYKEKRTVYKHYIEYCIGRKIKNKKDFINIIKNNIEYQLNMPHKMAFCTMFYYNINNKTPYIFKNRFKTLDELNNLFIYKFNLLIANENFTEIKAEDIRNTTNFKNFFERINKMPF